ncbi:MAG: alpha/beta hydrolase, partial [Gemmatimonadaceae bacterium]
LAVRADAVGAYGAAGCPRSGLGSIARAAGVAVVALGVLSCSARDVPRDQPDAARKPAQTAWRDPSPHVIRFVGVAPGVRLEVLDWGGSGPPLVFLAGYGNSAHVFDGFAPQFADRFRVLAVTRRGFGASSHPDSGYTSATLAADVLAVLDTLGLRRVSLVAHSYGGSEVNYLAAHSPGRVDRLVYLDAGFDFAELYADPEWTGSRAPFPPSPPYGDGSPAAATLYSARVTGPGYPEAEVRATSRLDSAGKLAGSTSSPALAAHLQRGTVPAEFAGIRAPALAIYGVPSSAPEKYPFWESLDSAGRERAQVRYEAEAHVMARQRARFRREVALARVVELHGGRHYIFLTHAPEVAHEMRLFLLPPDGRPTAPR